MKESASGRRTGFVRSAWWLRDRCCGKDRPIKEVAIDLGFTTSKMFSRDFLLFYGVKPTDFQRKEYFEQFLNVAG